MVPGSPRAGSSGGLAMATDHSLMKALAERFPNSRLALFLVQFPHKTGPADPKSLAQSGSCPDRCTLQRKDRHGAARKRNNAVGALVSFMTLRLAAKPLARKLRLRARHPDNAKGR